MRLIHGSLSGGDFYSNEHIQSFAWPLLLQTGGLASGARMMLTVKGKAALKRDPDEVLTELWERWLRKGSLDEISRVEEVKGKTRTNVLSALGHRRIAAAHSLKLLSTRGFLRIDELFAATMKCSPFTCARNERSTWKFYIEHSQYGSMGYSDHDFERVVDRRYLMVLLFEYVATLGLVDVRFIRPEGAQDDIDTLNLADPPERLSRYDGLIAVRPTSLALELLMA